jgi:hypothetical protein
MMNQGLLNDLPVLMDMLEYRGSIYDKLVSYLPIVDLHELVVVFNQVLANLNGVVMLWQNTHLKCGDQQGMNP